MFTRRSAFAVFAAALAAPVAAAFAQTGGMPSTTAPSNSEGTPAASTGIVGTTRVGPSTPVATSHRRRRHHRRHRASTTAQ